MKIENKNVIELANGKRYMGSDIKYIYSDSTLNTLIYIRDAEVQGELSKTERAILSGLSHEYKWIARDEDGGLYVFKTKPRKSEISKLWRGEYGDHKEYASFEIYNHLFKFITWDASEPHSIPSLIAHY